jgi:hypothetical protein
VRRHDTDWLALSLGGLYLVVAAVHIGDGDGAGGTDGLKWFIPGVLLVLGVLGIIGAVRGGRTPAGVTAGPAAHPPAPASTPAPDARSADQPTVRLDQEPTERLDQEPTVRLDREADLEPEPDEGPEADEGEGPRR